MTRVTIIYEGIDQGFGYVVENGATEWKEGEEYPIVNNFNFDNPKHLIGKATDVRREENGEITAEVPEELIIRDISSPFLFGEHDKIEGAAVPLVSFAAYTNGVVMDPPEFNEDEPDKKNPRLVKKCVLKAVGRVPIISAANPGASIKP